MKGNCRIDTDCGEGGFCSPSTAESCGNMSGVTGYWCHTSKDTCKNDSDCAAQQNGYCSYHETIGAWACSYGICAG
jgi:hypothetical protein